MKGDKMEKCNFVMLQKIMSVQMSSILIDPFLFAALLWTFKGEMISSSEVQANRLLVC